MNEITKVAFPGLGIGMMELNKVAFTLFGTLEVRWYALFITFGIVLAFLHAIWRGNRDEGVITDDVLDVGLATVVCGVIGARLYYVLTTLDSGNYNSFTDVIAIWNGGLGIYGGIIGGCLGILGVCLWKRIDWRTLFDMIAPGVVIAQAMGRWGNFFNGEAHGYAIGETTRFYFFNKEYLLESGEGTLFHLLRMDLGSGICYHPAFFYESVWNLCGFVFLTLLYRKRKFHGQVALMYFAWYGFGRMFVEGLRSDSLYIPGTTIRISQFLGLCAFLVSTGILIYMLIKKHHDEPLPAIAVAAKEGGAEECAEAENSAEDEHLSMELQAELDLALEVSCDGTEEERNGTTETETEETQNGKAN